MATEKAADFSPLDLHEFEKDRKVEIKMERQERGSRRRLLKSGEASLDSEVETVIVAASPQGIKQEVGEGPSSRQWDVSWQDYQDASRSPLSEQEDLELEDAAEKDDVKDPLSHTEGAAAASRWAKGRTRPRLGLRTAQEDQSVKSDGGSSDEQASEAAEAASPECQRQRFRQFGYEEAEGPWEAYCQLRKFCHQWLMPERHTKEEILELVILEQFLAILPPEMLSWIRERDSESCFHAVALAEHFLLRQRESQRQEQQVGVKEEAAVSFSAEEGSSLDLTLRQLYREVKEEEEDEEEEEEEEASVLGDEGQNENDGTPLEGKNCPDIEETISKPAEPKEYGTEELRIESVAPEGESAAEEAAPKLKRPSDRLFHGLNRHQRNSSGQELYDCSDCGKVFVSRAGFIMHIRVHGREKPYECADCGKNFRRSSHLNNHSKIHAGVKPFKCSDCGKGFSRNSNLISHQRMHTGEKPYSCSSCSKQFCDKSSLVRHERLHTGDRPYKCTACGKSFSQSHHLITHHRSHTGEKPYQCLLCSKSFCDRSTYIRHQKNHTGEKTFKCSECGECFSRNKHLIRHQSIHTARELHTCSDCGESFCRRSGLKMHQKIHTGEKPFECTDCGKKFNRSTNLISHQRIHTGERPYGCPDCGKRFNRRTHLVSHQKIHGPRKESPETIKTEEELPSDDNFLHPSYIITRTL